MAENPIIVIQRFDNPIQANIMKAKLDAYGIPCFLSEENITLLTTPFLSGGVRLHIFEQDKERVVQLMAEEILQHDDNDDLMVCPNCHSRKILKVSNHNLSPSGMVKFILQLTKRHYCLNCETEFD